MVVGKLPCLAWIADTHYLVCGIKLKKKKQGRWLLTQPKYNVDESFYS